MLPYQLLKLTRIGIDPLVAREAGEFHMAVLEHVDFQSLADDRHCDHHRIWSVAINPVPEMLLVHQAEDAVEFVTHSRV